MRNQIISLLICLFCFTVSNVWSQIEATKATDVQTALPEIEANLWDFESQIKSENIQNPQFADLIRKRLLKKKISTNKEFDATLERKVQIGEERIKAGKATTTFKFDPNLSLKNYLLLKSDSDELRQIVEQNADVCLKMFRQNLQARKLRQNDIVDAGALAFILSHEIYFGIKPSNSHLNWMRKKGREILMNSPGFQGVDDDERQRTFEIFGVLTMYAQILQKKGLRGNKEAGTEAKETAGEVLKQVWGNPTDSIQILPKGFIHKGVKIISDKQATQFFNFNPNLQTAKKLSNGNLLIETQYRSLLSGIYREMFLRKMANNDIATCGTYTFSTIYPYLSDAGELNKEQLESVYEVFKNASLNSIDIQAASDETKQIACEVFAIRGALLKNQISVNNDSNVSKLLAEQFLSQLFNAYGKVFREYKMLSNKFIKIEQ